MILRKVSGSNHQLGKTTINTIEISFEDLDHKLLRVTFHAQQDIPPENHPVIEDVNGIVEIEMEEADSVNEVTSSQDQEPSQDLSDKEIDNDWMPEDDNNFFTREDEGSKAFATSDNFNDNKCEENLQNSNISAQANNDIGSDKVNDSFVENSVNEVTSNKFVNIESDESLSEPIPAKAHADTPSHSASPNLTRQPNSTSTPEPSPISPTDPNDTKGLANPCFNLEAEVNEPNGDNISIDRTQPVNIDVDFGISLQDTFRKELPCKK
ncbi:uncharacterized protein [Rutidosis leptorrhynchoides]|uniref:uncharacterized protein n=1 Tax=Rutidosis leptorrhynchoides TaxID=125765 RepID=UPI003A9A37A2